MVTREKGRPCLSPDSKALEALSIAPGRFPKWTTLGPAMPFPFSPVPFWNLESLNGYCRSELGQVHTYFLSNYGLSQSFSGRLLLLGKHMHVCPLRFFFPPSLPPLSRFLACPSFMAYVAGAQ